MPNFRTSVVSLMPSLAMALAATAAFAQEPGPDALVRTVSSDVIAAIKQDREIRAGNSRKIVELVETRILPHVDTGRMTRLAVGTGWRQATPEQQQRLAEEFTTLLVHTYSGALASYSDQVLEVKPARIQSGDTETTVRSEIRQPGAQSITIDYALAKRESGWKVYDVRIAGVSLVTTYRSTFSEEIRNRGIEGLIALLAAKNRQNSRRITQVQS
jgi:phospholipid transport system substrate-binding protein